MRSLKQLLEKTYRKVALKLVKAGLVGRTPDNTEETPAQPGDVVSEQGGVGTTRDEPQQAPPESSISGMHSKDDWEFLTECVRCQDHQNLSGFVKTCRDSS